MRPEFFATLAAWEWDVALLQEVPPWWPQPLAQACGADYRRVLTSRNFCRPLRRALWCRFPDQIRSNQGGANAILVRGTSIAEHRRLRLRWRPERRWMHRRRRLGLEPARHADPEQHDLKATRAGGRLGSAATVNCASQGYATSITSSSAVEAAGPGEVLERPQRLSDPRPWRSACGRTRRPMRRHYLWRGRTPAARAGRAPAAAAATATSLAGDPVNRLKPIRRSAACGLEHRRGLRPPARSGAGRRTSLRPLLRARGMDARRAALPRRHNRPPRASSAPRSGLARARTRRGARLPADLRSPGVARSRLPGGDWKARLGPGRHRVKSEASLETDRHSSPRCSRAR